MTVLTPASVFRKYETDGIPSSGAHEPKKAEIVQLLELLFGVSRGGWVVATTLAELNAITPENETDGGVVLTGAGAGYYDRSGAAWVFGRGFPDSVAVLTDIGGTANAITASTAAGVDPSTVQMLLLPDPPGTNTSATVTIALNGGSAENIRAASGAALAIGDIIAGVGTLFFRFGSEWRQLFSSRTGATFDHQGTYASGTTYTEGQVVTGSDGNWYQLKAASATGDDPVSGGSGDWLEILSGVAIADGSLTESKYATGSVSTRAMADKAATLAKIGDDAKADFRLVDPNGPRVPVSYYNGWAVQIRGIQSIAMGGFRYGGRYLISRAPVFDLPAGITGDRHIIDLGQATGTLIPGATGANIGDLTFNGGLTAAFDGTSSKIFDNCAAETSSGFDGLGYIGKNYSSAPHRIQRVVVYGSSDFGFDSTGSASSITLTLYGKNGSAPANSSDGTSLGTVTFSDASAASRQITCSDQDTSWDYIWVQVDSTVTARIGVAALEVYEYAPLQGDLFAETEHATNCWYAQFAAANDGDATATLGSMPFLRVGSISGNVITFNQSGENQRSVAAKTHKFTTDGLVGCDVLVISETLDSRANAFSGRVAKVTANTQTTITLDDAGTLGVYDYILVAPPGFDHYCYLNTCYIDTAEIRNIADDGYHVQSRGGDNLQASYSDALSVPVQIPCDGHISPLATGVEFDHNETVSGSTTGIGTVRYGMDTSHDVYSNQWRKTAASSEAWTMHVPPITFAGYFGQSVWLYNAGTLNIAGNTRKMQMRGWVEP